MLENRGWIGGMFLLLAMVFSVEGEGKCGVLPAQVFLAKGEKRQIVFWTDKNYSEELTTTMATKTTAEMFDSFLQAVNGEIEMPKGPNSTKPSPQFSTTATTPTSTLAIGASTPTAFVPVEDDLLPIEAIVAEEEEEDENASEAPTTTPQQAATNDPIMTTLFSTASAEVEEASTVSDVQEEATTVSNVQEEATTVSDVQEETTTKNVDDDVPAGDAVTTPGSVDFTVLSKEETTLASVDEITTVGFGEKAEATTTMAEDEMLEPTTTTTQVDDSLPAEVTETEESVAVEDLLTESTTVLVTDEVIEALTEGESGQTYYPLEESEAETSTQTSEAQTADDDIDEEMTTESSQQSFFEVTITTSSAGIEESNGTDVQGTESDIDVLDDEADYESTSEIASLEEFSTPTTVTPPVDDITLSTIQLLQQDVETENIQSSLLTTLGKEVVTITERMEVNDYTTEMGILETTTLVDIYDDDADYGIDETEKYVEDAEDETTTAASVETRTVDYTTTGSPAHADGEFPVEAVVADYDEEAVFDETTTGSPHIAAVETVTDPVLSGELLLENPDNQAQSSSTTSTTPLPIEAVVAEGEEDDEEDEGSYDADEYDSDYYHSDSHIYAETTTGSPAEDQNTFVVEAVVADENEDADDDEQDENVINDPNSLLIANSGVTQKIFDDTTTGTILDDDTDDEVNSDDSKLTEFPTTTAAFDLEEEEETTVLNSEFVKQSSNDFVAEETTTNAGHDEGGDESVTYMTLSVYDDLSEPEVINKDSLSTDQAAVDEDYVQPNIYFPVNDFDDLSVVGVEIVTSKDNSSDVQESEGTEPDETTTEIGNTQVIFYEESNLFREESNEETTVPPPSNTPLDDDIDSSEEDDTTTVHADYVTSTMVTATETPQTTVVNGFVVPNRAYVLKKQHASSPESSAVTLIDQEMVRTAGGNQANTASPVEDVETTTKDMLVLDDTTLPMNEADGKIFDDDVSGTSTEAASPAEEASTLAFMDDVAMSNQSDKEVTTEDDSHDTSTIEFDEEDDTTTLASPILAALQTKVEMEARHSDEDLSYDDDNSLGDLSEESEGLSVDNEESELSKKKKKPSGLQVTDLISGLYKLIKGYIPSGEEDKKKEDGITNRLDIQKVDPKRQDAGHNVGGEDHPVNRNRFQGQQAPLQFFESPNVVPLQQNGGYNTFRESTTPFTTPRLLQGEFNEVIDDTYSNTDPFVQLSAPDLSASDHDPAAVQQSDVVLVFPTSKFNSQSTLSPFNSPALRVEEPPKDLFQPEEKQPQGSDQGPFNFNPLALLPSLFQGNNQKKDKAQNKRHNGPIGDKKPAGPGAFVPIQFRNQEVGSRPGQPRLAQRPLQPRLQQRGEPIAIQLPDQGDEHLSRQRRFSSKTGNQFDPVESLRNPDKHLIEFIESTPLPMRQAFLRRLSESDEVIDRRKREAEPVNCTWTIETEKNLYLLVTFHNLSAPFKVDCAGAYIEVERERNGFEARWCGNRLTQGGSRPHVIFARSEVRITVFDDGSEGKPLPTGFNADVEVIDLFDSRAYDSTQRGTNGYSNVRKLNG